MAKPGLPVLFFYPLPSWPVQRRMAAGLSALALAWLGQALPVGAQTIPNSRPTQDAADAGQSAACEADLNQPIPSAAVAPDLPPASLNANPNPLSLPTRPEEVTLSGSQPLSLEQALQLAYANAPSLEASRLELAQSQAALEETLASLYPTVDLAASLVYLSSPPGLEEAAGQLELGNVPTLATLAGTATANYEVATGGRRQAEIRAAELAVRQQELALEQAQAALRLDTTTQYYTLQETVEQIRISQAFLAEACRNLRDTSLFFAAEVGTRFDVLRAEVQVATARQDLIRALSQWRSAQRQLAEQLNLPPTVTVSTTAVAPAGSWPLSLEESIVLAWQNRAELEQSLLDRDIGAAQTQIALARLRPQLQAFSDIGFNSLLNVSVEDQSNIQLGGDLGLQANWRVYDGGAAKAAADQAQAQIAISDQQYSQTRNQVRLAVEQAYYNLESSFTNIDTARASVEQAKEALRLARRRFDAGVGDQLEVLTAQRELTEAEVNLVQAVLGYNRSLAALERAVSNLAPANSTQ